MGGGTGQHTFSWGSCIDGGDGHFATLWKQIALKHGLVPEFIPGDWRHGVDATHVEASLAGDSDHAIKAVCVVHNETSTGVTSDVPAVRRALDSVGHSALLLVDTISSLASIDYRHDEWGVDVTVGASQKGLMLPPGLSFNAISEKALAASEHATMSRSFWEWAPILKANKNGFFPYTPATNLLYGLREALRMLFDEGLENVFARHDRHAEATRRAVTAWGLELLCIDESEYSSSITAIMMPDGHDSSHLLDIVLKHFDMSLGVGLSNLAGKVFRIGHLGDFNDLSLVGTLGGVEMGLTLAGVPHTSGGVTSALTYLGECANPDVKEPVAT